MREFKTSKIWISPVGCTNANFLILILHCSYAGCYHRGNWVKMIRNILVLITFFSRNFLWIYNYFKINCLQIYNSRHKGNWSGIFWTDKSYNDEVKIVLIFAANRIVSNYIEQDLLKTPEETDKAPIIEQGWNKCIRQWKFKYKKLSQNSKHLYHIINEVDLIDEHFPNWCPFEYIKT